MIITIKLHWYRVVNLLVYMSTVLFLLLADIPGVAKDIMICPQEEVWQSMIKPMSKGLAYVPFFGQF